MADGRDETPVNEQPDEARDPEMADETVEQPDEFQGSEPSDAQDLVADPAEETAEEEAPEPEPVDETEPAVEAQPSVAAEPTVEAEPANDSQPVEEPVTDEESEAKLATDDISGQAPTDNAEPVVEAADGVEPSADVAEDSESSHTEASTTIEPSVAPKRSVSPIPILSTPPANPLAPLGEQDAVNQLYVDTDVSNEASAIEEAAESNKAQDDAAEDTAVLDTAVLDTAVLDTAVSDNSEFDNAPEDEPSDSRAVEPTDASLAGTSVPALASAQETQTPLVDSSTNSVSSLAGTGTETPEIQATQRFEIPTQPGPTQPGPTQPSPLNQANSSVSTEPRAPFLTPHSETTASGPKKDSPLNEFDQEKSGRGWLKGLVATVVTLLVLGGAYTGAQYLFADKIAKAVTVAGVDVGGLTQNEAVAKLEEQLSPALSKDMALSAGELSTVLVPNKAGIAFDAQQTVAGTTGFSWDPTRLWTHLVGGDPIEPVITVDDAVFTQSIESVASSLLVEPIDGTVSFVDGKAIATEAKDGSKVDVTTAKEKVVSNLFTTVRPIALTTETTEPQVTQAKTDEAFAQAQKIASAAVTVKVGDKKAEVPSNEFTKHIVVDAADGSFSFTYSGEALVDEVLKRTQNLLTDAKDARFEFKNGKPVIIPGTAGTTIDPEALATAFSQAALADTRVAEIKLTESDPEQSTEALEKLGVKEIVASFSTPLPGGALRTENLRVAASRVTGTLVKPGEEFDLTKVIGPISKANGYHDAGVIVNGVHTEGVGGGLSQMSTTTYNAGFFAGMTDIAHRPHSVWFQRYPAGRESTLFVGSINMVWRNDSPTGILMRSYVANGKVTVEAWGTKTYEVTTTTSPHRNIVKAQVTTSTAADCVAYGKGEDGFTVTVTRKVKEIATSKVVKDEAKTWTYRPDNGVSCKKKEPATPTTPDNAGTEN